MRRTFFILLGFVVFTLAGCAFNRSDFVSGANGKPKDDEVSDNGKTVGNFVRTGGPSLRLSY
jgi:hypothetical protein